MFFPTLGVGIGFSMCIKNERNILRDIMLTSIKKRDSRVVPFDEEKIVEAIFRAAGSQGGTDKNLARSIADQVVQELEKQCGDQIPDVEDLQDIVERTLIKTGHARTAKAYILYRNERTRVREMKTRLMATMFDLSFKPAQDNDLKRENANIDGDTAMGTMLKYGSEAAKQFYEMFLLKPEHSRAHNEGDIHIHDLDFLSLTTTCCQIDIKKLFDGGFNTGHGFLREPNSIQSYSALACIAIQSNQNDQHGGQSIPNFDYGMAKGVAKSFAKNIKLVLDLGDYCQETMIQDIYKSLRHYLEKKESLLDEAGMEYTYNLLLQTALQQKIADKILIKALKKTERDTYQAMEGLIHNLNTMHCLPGSEKIWVFHHETLKFGLLSIKELCSRFVPNLWSVMSLNKTSGKIELKRILGIQKKDNHRDLVTLYTSTGQKVRVTTNHKVMTLDDESNICESLPDTVKTILSPRDFITVLMAFAAAFGDNPEFSLADDLLIRTVLLLNKIPKVNESCAFFPIEVTDKVYSNSGEEYVYDLAVEGNENFLTEDCLFVHNSRAGAQIPFSSINYGTDTSPEGRMVVKQLLLSTDAGLGNGETPIFPIQIFKIKDGINYNPGEDNYDLFQLACKVSAKRLFPNFSFLDAPFNLQYYKKDHPETEIAYMGCRTRVIGNIHDPQREIVTGRGNLSFTSLNLPRLGIKHTGDISGFFEELDEKISLVFNQLLERLEIQSAKKCRNYPFLMGQGIWIDSEYLKPDDDVREVLKHGSLTIGFIGLAECLKALIGHHHGESAEAQKLGLQIIGHIRERADKKTQETRLNFTVIATPAEGLSGRFVAIDKKIFGILPGITDRSYYTNSFHIPVYFPISAYNKIRLEAPYHPLTNGGHITYVEVDGNPLDNLEAFESIIRAMKEAGIGYGSINHPVDRDPVCGYTGIIGDVCPRCGRRDGEGIPLAKLLKIKGYIHDHRSLEERQEVPDRVPHYHL